MTALICVAPNGARKTKKDHPHLPVNDNEIIKEICLSREAGATMAHIHIRDNQGNHSLESGHYNLLLKSLRKAVGQEMILQITTESCGQYTADQQRNLVYQTKAEAASLSIKEFCQTEEDKREFSKMLFWMKQERKLPQFILYDYEDVKNLKNLEKNGMVPFEKPHILLVLGRKKVKEKSKINRTARPIDLLSYLKKNKFDNYHWSVCAFGFLEHHCLTTAMLLGGHCRIGFENNIFLHEKRKARNNAELIKRLSNCAKSLDISIMSLFEAREFFENSFS